SAGGSAGAPGTLAAALRLGSHGSPGSQSLRRTSRTRRGPSRLRAATSVPGLRPSVRSPDPGLATRLLRVLVSGVRSRPRAGGRSPSGARSEESEGPHGARASFEGLTSERNGEPDRGSGPEGLRAPGRPSDAGLSFGSEGPERPRRSGLKT